MSVTPRPTGCAALTQQQPMNVCFADQFRQYEARLSGLVAELKNHFDRASYSRLLAGQTQWAAYRNSECALEASRVEGGSAEPMFHAVCLDKKTWDRIDELKLWLCRSAGMDGDCPASRRYNDRPAE